MHFIIELALTSRSPAVMVSVNVYGPGMTR